MVHSWRCHSCTHSTSQGQGRGRFRGRGVLGGVKCRCQHQKWVLVWVVVRVPWMQRYLKTRTWLIRSRNRSCLSRPAAGGFPCASITRSACRDSCRAVYARNDLQQKHAIAGFRHGHLQVCIQHDCDDIWLNAHITCRPCAQLGNENLATLSGNMCAQPRSASMAASDRHNCTVRRGERSSSTVHAVEAMHCIVEKIQTKTFISSSVHLWTLSGTWRPSSDSGRY